MNYSFPKDVEVLIHSPESENGLICKQGLCKWSSEDDVIRTGLEAGEIQRERPTQGRWHVNPQCLSHAAGAWRCSQTTCSKPFHQGCLARPTPWSQPFCFKPFNLKLLLGLPAKHGSLRALPFFGWLDSLPGSLLGRLLFRFPLDS